MLATNLLYRSHPWYIMSHDHITQGEISGRPVRKVTDNKPVRDSSVLVQNYQIRHVVTFTRSDQILPGDCKRVRGETYQSHEN